MVAGYDSDTLLPAAHLRRHLLHELFELVILEVARSVSAVAALVVEPVTTVQQEAHRVSHPIEVKTGAGSSSDSSCTIETNITHLIAPGN